MFYAIPDVSLMSTRQSFRNFIRRLDCIAGDIDGQYDGAPEEVGLNARLPPQLDGNVFSYDPSRRCRSQNYACCNDYNSTCTEVYGGGYRRGFGIGSLFGAGHRPSYPQYMPPIPIERRIAHTEYIDPLVMTDSRLGGRHGNGSYGGGSYSGRYGGSYLSEVECHTCITRRVACTRTGFRQIRPGYSECSRWLGGGGCASGMRGFDGEAPSPCASQCGSPYRERLDPISETSEAPEMSGGLNDDDDTQSHGYETAPDSISFLAADVSDPTQLDVCPTPDKNKAEKTVRDVKALIDKDGNNRTWVLNIEELCRTECCRFKRAGSEGVLQKTAPHLRACKESCWKSNNCKGERDCKHKPPAIRFFESLGSEYLEKIHSIRLQTKEATFLNPFEVASAVDLVIRTFPKVKHARIILHSDEDGEIEDKDTVKLLVRTFRKLQRSLPLVEELRIIGIEQHPRLMRKWNKNKHQKRSNVIRISYRLRGRGIRVKSKWTIRR